MNDRLSLQDRIARDLGPIAELLNEVVDTAFALCPPQQAQKAYPGLPAAILSRLNGTAAWGYAAQGLVDARDRFPWGYAVASTTKQQNAGKYVFSFPGGVFTLRQIPHDDTKDEGQFFQESFAQVCKQLDDEGAPDAKDGIKVWVKIARGGATKLIAEDRHGHLVRIELTDLLYRSDITSVKPATSPAADRTRVRPLRQDEQADGSQKQ